MPRASRLYMPDLLQHVIVRGIERRDIFLEKKLMLSSFHGSSDSYMR